MGQWAQDVHLDFHTAHELWGFSFQQKRLSWNTVRVVALGVGWGGGGGGRGGLGRGQAVGFSSSSVIHYVSKTRAQLGTAQDVHLDFHTAHELWGFSFQQKRLSWNTVRVVALGVGWGGRRVREGSSRGIFFFFSDSLRLENARTIRDGPWAQDVHLDSKFTQLMNYEDFLSRQKSLSWNTG